MKENTIRKFLFAAALALAVTPFAATPAHAVDKGSTVVNADDGRCATQVPGYGAHTVPAECTGADTQRWSQVLPRTVAGVTYVHFQSAEDGRCLTRGYGILRWEPCELSDTVFDQEFHLDAGPKGTVVIRSRGNPDYVVGVRLWKDDTVLLQEFTGATWQYWTVTA